MQANHNDDKKQNIRRYNSMFYLMAYSEPLVGFTKDSSYPQGVYGIIRYIKCMPWIMEI